MKISLDSKSSFIQVPHFVLSNIPFPSRIGTLPPPLPLPGNHLITLRTLIPTPVLLCLAPFLRNLAPPASTTFPLILRQRSTATAESAVALGVRFRDDTLVGEFTAADEFFGEATAVESLGGGVYAVGDDVGLGREEEELGAEVVDCEKRLSV